MFEAKRALPQTERKCTTIVVSFFAYSIIVHFKPIHLLSSDLSAAPSTYYPQRSRPLLLQNHLDSIPRRQTIQARLEKHVRNALIAALPALRPITIPHHVKVSTHRPPCPHHGRCDRKFQACQKERAKHGWLVLNEVCVRTLGAVEEIGFFVGACLLICQLVWCGGVLGGDGG